MNVNIHMRLEEVGAGITPADIEYLINELFKKQAPTRFGEVKKVKSRITGDDPSMVLIDKQYLYDLSEALGSDPDGVNDCALIYAASRITKEYLG